MSRYAVVYNTTLGRLEYKVLGDVYTKVEVTGGGSGAPVGAEYVVLSANGTLTNESVLSVAGDGIALDTSTPGSVVVQTEFTSNQLLLGRNTSGAGLGEEVGLTQVLDWASGTARGAILYRGAVSWFAMPPGTSGFILTSQGPGADPIYAGVGTALNVISTTQGAILSRGAATWGAINPGTSGYVLTSQGPGADLTWTPAAGVTDHDDLNNLDWSMSGHTGTASRIAAFDGTGAAVESTLSDLLDTLSTSHGAILYRDSGTWQALAPGTANYILRSNGSGADPSWVDGGTYFAGLLLAPRVTTITKTRMWSQVAASGSGSASFVASTAIFVLHFDPHGTTYTAFETRVITTAGTSKYRVAVYTHGSDGQPDELLWTGNEIDSGTTGTTGTKTQTFASDGTWVASPGAYKDGSDRLRLERGQAVWVVYDCQGTAAMRNIPLGACRSLGHDPADANPVTGLTATITYTTPASPYPANTSALTFADRKAELPFLGLVEL